MEKCIKYFLLICVALGLLKTETSAMKDEEDKDKKTISAFPIKDKGSDADNFKGDISDLNSIISTIELFDDVEIEDKKQFVNSKIKDCEDIIKKINSQYEEDTSLIIIKEKINAFKNKYK